MLRPATAANVDTAELRKARGAFFTPEPIARFIADWAIRDREDGVLEPSAGDAAFLVEAVRRLRQVAPSGDLTPPTVHGVEIHAHSARTAAARVREAGGEPHIAEGDFFCVKPRAEFSAVIGNPPFIRYQDFAGEARRLSREAALQAGVALTALASSWAAFAVHSALFLKPGGRLGLVLPAELLSVNYASAVRRFLLDRFKRVELVLFDEQVFPEAEADVLLLLADGFDEGPSASATIYQAKDADALANLGRPVTWTPPDPAAKWTGLLVDTAAIEALNTLTSAGALAALQTWGETTLGMVTGNNAFFALSPARVRELDLARRDLLRLSPPGSSHLRGLDLSTAQLQRLGREGRATWLFRPSEKPSDAALEYIETGRLAGVDQAYKCRVRKPWYRVPLVPPADLFLTCMNADTPRLTTNTVGVHHLNSVHGLYLTDRHRELGRELLPLASLNSATLLSAEVVGRSYGGGILKLEPREADVWAVPSPGLVAKHAERLREIRKTVASRLHRGDLAGSVAAVDDVLLADTTAADLTRIRQARAAMAERRATRGRSG